MPPYYCIIPTTRRPFYAERLRSRMDTYERLAALGLTVVFVYADEAAQAVTYTQKEGGADGLFELVVPVPDSYIYLGSKLEVAYRHVYGLGAAGIIKMDDDVDIHYWNCIKELVDSDLFAADYFGIAYSTYPAGVHPVNPAHLPLHSLQLCWYLPHDLRFFLGGFYALSRRSLEAVCTHGLPFPGEDVSVAYALSKIEGVRAEYRDWFAARKIGWE